MKTALIYSEKIKKYDFGEGHPFRGDRFPIFMNFFKENFPQEKFKIIKPEEAKDEEILLVHDKKYMDTIKAASEGKTKDIYDVYGYVSGDNLNPLTRKVPKGIEEGARVAVGTSVLAGELIAEGKFKKAIGIGGGLHHAKPSYGEGFCLYNDVAICAENLKQKYNFKRILILDTDAHAGNGVKEIFYKDPSVLFVDLHQDPKTIYPGTGFASEIGAGEGEGFTVNLPLTPGAGDNAYQYLFEEIISPLAKEFKPEIIIRYGGSDPYYLDGLTSLGLTLNGFKMIGEKVRGLSALCEGKVIDLLLSGYNMKVLPYAWSALISGLLNLNVTLDLKERNLPQENSGYGEAKLMVKKLKNNLKEYWRCFEK